MTTQWHVTKATRFSNSPRSCLCGSQLANTAEGACKSLLLTQIRSAHKAGKSLMRQPTVPPFFSLLHSRPDTILHNGFWNYPFSGQAKITAKHLTAPGCIGPELKSCPWCLKNRNIQDKHSAPPPHLFPISYFWIFFRTLPSPLVIIKQVKTTACSFDSLWLEKNLGLESLWSTG